MKNTLHTLERAVPARRPGADDEEWHARCELAACYRLAHHYGWDDIVWNHITARLPGAGSRFLLNRFGLRYDEVTASNLVTLNQDGEVLDGPPGINVTGFVIHSGIYTARPDINCVMHTHTAGGLAFSCLEEPLKPLINDVMMFHKRVAYHDYEGLSTELDERDRIARALGRHNAMILRNHGLLTTGRSAGEAFVLMYYLERACRVHLEVLQSGRPFIVPPDEVCEKAARHHEQEPPGTHEWPALLRLLDERHPSYKT